MFNRLLFYLVIVSTLLFSRQTLGDLGDVLWPVSGVESEFLFNARIDYDVGGRPVSVATGDLDGDADLDLAVANMNGDNVSVLLGNGDGTFRSAVNYEAGNQPLFVAIGDLDGDGDLDLAVANSIDNDVSVLLGNGDGTFQSPINYGAGHRPESVAIGDLDGDGDLDLAVANSYGDNVPVLLGNGDGTFQSAVTYGAGDSPRSVAIGDLDGDGDLDLAVTNHLDDNVSVLLGNGDGTFQSAVNYGAGAWSTCVAIGDLDGDADLDLAVANMNDDNASVLFGNDDGTFQSPVTYGAGDFPRSVAIGDLDGDGDLDLVVANSAVDNVSVLINTDADGDGISDDLLIFPHIASNTNWETEICIINTSNQQSLSGKLKAYRNSGQLISSTPLNLGTDARWEITIGDYFLDPAIIGYMIFEADSSTLCGYTKFYVEGKYRVAVPAASEVNTGDIYISHIASNSDWWTGISLLNTNSSSKALTIEFDNGTTKTKTIAAKEHQMFTVKSLFGGAIQPNIKAAVIKNGSGFVGLELFGSTDSTGNNYLSGVLLSDYTTTSIYYPHIASNSTWWTGLVAYNPSSTACNLTITPFTADGISLSSQMLPLNGLEKYIGTAKALNFPAGTAWFKIDATNPITGFELFGTTSGNQMGGYTGVGISSTDGVFAKIEKSGGWTGIAFVNIEDSSAAVTMTAYNDSGNIIATETIVLSAYEKVVAAASNLFSQDISNATCIAYSSTGNVVGFQLNGSSDDMMLDALPGM